MAKTIFYFTQKGGCGKSTLSIITAGFLLHTKGKRVLLIDADLQHSVILQRNNEERMYEETHGDQDLGFVPYRVIACDLADVESIIRENTEDYDFIVVDTPGSLNNPKILETLLHANYVITPCEHAQQSLIVTLKSASAVTKAIKNMEGSCIEKVACMFNKVPFSQLGKIKKYRPGLEQVGFDYIFENVVGDCPTISRMDKSSTVYPIDPDYVEITKGNGKFNIGGYLEELSQMIGI